MRKKILTILPVLVMAFFPASQAYDLSPDGKGWELATDKAEFKIYTRNLDGGEIDDVMMVGVIEVVPEKLFYAVTDYDDFPEYMPYVEYAHLIHTDQESPDKAFNYVFFFISPPLISARYYTLKLTDEKNPDSQPGAYRSKWDLVTSGTYHETMESPGIKQVLHGKTGVETTANQGYWLFQPLDGGVKTRVSYYVKTNPGGSVPHWITNKAQTTALPNLWAALKKRAKGSSS